MASSIWGFSRVDEQRGEEGGHECTSPAPAFATAPGDVELLVPRHSDDRVGGDIERNNQ